MKNEGYVIDIFSSQVTQDHQNGNDILQLANLVSVYSKEDQARIYKKNNEILETTWLGQYYKQQKKKSALSTVTAANRNDSAVRRAMFPVNQHWEHPKPQQMTKR